MKLRALTLILGLATPCLADEPTMREKINSVLANSDQRPQPPRTAKEMTKATAKSEVPDAEATVKLPDYEVVAPRTVIPNKAKIELELAKNEVAVRQEQAQLKATETDKVLNNDAFHYRVGPATFAFGLASESARESEARRRLSVLDLEQTIVLTTLASSPEDQKELRRLLAGLKAPTAY